MKLASITLPLPDEQQRGPYSPGRVKYAGMTDAHKEVKRILLDWCNGYTRVPVQGAWCAKSGAKVMYEDAYQYAFTSPDTETAQAELRALAFRIKIISDEEAIFIVHANGETEIVR